MSPCAPRLSPSNLIILVQQRAPGHVYDKDTRAFRVAPEAPPRPAGSGYALLALGWPGDAFRLQPVAAGGEGAGLGAEGAAGWGRAGGMQQQHVYERVGMERSALADFMERWVVERGREPGWWWAVLLGGKRSGLGGRRRVAKGKVVGRSHAYCRRRSATVAPLETAANPQQPLFLSCSPAPQQG